MLEKAVYTVNEFFLTVPTDDDDGKVHNWLVAEILHTPFAL
jgi:hypothetical protein